MEASVTFSNRNLDQTFPDFNQQVPEDPISAADSKSKKKEALSKALRENLLKRKAQNRLRKNID